MDLVIEPVASAAEPALAFLEHSMVSLTVDVDQEGVRLPAGSQGAVVFIYEGAPAYEVEFVEPLHAVLTLRADQLTQ